MSSPQPGVESYRDRARRERLEAEQALQDLENSEEGREETLTLEENLERSRSEANVALSKHFDGSRFFCAEHKRPLTYPEWTGGGCLWCIHGGQEEYAEYLASMNIDRFGRRRRMRGTQAIS